VQDIFWQIKRLGESVNRMTIFVNEIKRKEIQNALVYATAYLFVFEGMYISCLNSIIYALVCYGHDLFDPLRGKYADTPEKIALVDIEHKFRFLEKHGFNAIVLRKCQEIRNKIAHNDFEYSDNNSLKVTFSIKKGNGEVIKKDYDLTKEFESLTSFSTNLIEELEKFLNTSLNCNAQ
jgi:hypothetical protein